MKRSAYRDRDYAFGQLMLTLRTGIGITQSDLANFLGVSRRAVGDWEAGNSYPKAKHLKQFIALLVQHQVFHNGQEADEIRSLWKASGQKVLLDENWVADLLANMPKSGKKPFIEADSSSNHPIFQTRVNWQDAFSVPTFYGREWEHNQLTRWMVNDQCRMVGVLGLGGIGKSALSIQVMHQIADHFDVVIWRSLRNAPTCEAILEDCMNVLNPRIDLQQTIDIEQHLQFFLDCLRQQRVLIVFDNLESLLDEGDHSGHMRSKYEDYDLLLRRITETEHQSCLMFTSREKPVSLVPLEGQQSPVRNLRLSRLELKPCEHLLRGKGITGSDSEQARLIDTYAGNPLALKIVAQTILDLFGGNIAPFLDQGEIIFGGVRDLLAEQFARLSRLEQSVLFWLTILREPTTLGELRTVLMMPMPQTRLLDAIENLYRRSLLERGSKQGSFTLQSVVMEYMTAHLIQAVCEEILNGKLIRLVQYSLELAQVREYIRQTQERLIVEPILSGLKEYYVRKNDIEARLLSLLVWLRQQPYDEHGYAPTNLMMLLLMLRGNLNALDLSGLSIRGAYLQNVNLHDTTIENSVLSESNFTESFEGIISLKSSEDGQHWATSTTTGVIHLWKAPGFTLHHIWYDQSEVIFRIAINFDGSQLAGGTWDGRVKLWDVEHKSLIWEVDWRQYISIIYGMDFSPDGRHLAISGNDSCVRIVNTHDGSLLHTLPHTSQVMTIIWQSNGQILASGDTEGIIRFWEVRETEPAVCLTEFKAHDGFINGMAFAPDSMKLASGGADKTVKVWQVKSKLLLQTLEGHSDWVLRVGWSTDGHTLVSTGRDKLIILWDVEQGLYRAILRGHRMTVRGLAFSPNEGQVISASTDGTIRIWDMLNGVCMRVIQGCSLVITDIDWSSDGHYLVSGSTDCMVTIFSLQEHKQPRVLQGHTAEIFAVSYSPDGRWIASIERENTLILWDALTGKCIQKLHHPDTGNLFFYAAWSPDGKHLAIKTAWHGLTIWDISTDQPTWNTELLPFLVIGKLAWSPNSEYIATCGGDHQIYIWNYEGGFVQKLQGHHDKLTNVVWSPNGENLASASGTEIFIWSHADGTGFALSENSQIIHNDIAWGGNATTVITGDSDSKMRWWDTRTGEYKTSSEGHQRAIQVLKRCPDGRRIASSGEDGAIMVWDIHSGDHLQTVRRDRPYERLNITGIRGLTDVQKANLRALGAVEHDVI